MAGDIWPPNTSGYVHVVGIGDLPFGWPGPWEPAQPAYGPPAQGGYVPPPGYCDDCRRCPGCGRKHSEIPPKPTQVWC